MSSFSKVRSLNPLFKAVIGASSKVDPLPRLTALRRTVVTTSATTASNEDTPSFIYESFDDDSDAVSTREGFMTHIQAADSHHNAMAYSLSHCTQSDFSNPNFRNLLDDRMQAQLENASNDAATNSLGGGSDAKLVLAEPCWDDNLWH